MIRETKLITRTSKGNYIKCPATLEYDEGRITFLQSPFALKDEIKSMRGSKYHGYDSPPRKMWSVEDCQRNRFHIGYLEGEDVYWWFDRPLEKHEYRHSLMEHQRHLTDAGLTYHYQIWAAEAGTGKTLAAQSVVEESGVVDWWWVGPKNTLGNTALEFEKWGFPSGINVEYMSYDALVRRMREWTKDTHIPAGIIFDEASKAKNAATKRAKACQFVADLVRERYGFDGFVILMTGTPATKSPVDYWSQAEIAWPGFLREGSPRALERRLAFMVEQQFPTGTFKKRIGWKDDERKCNECGDYHLGVEEHDFVPSVNEVAYLHERLKGLLIVKFKKDCLSLPDKRYRVIRCEPSNSTMRAARTLVKAAPNTMTGLTWLRELSDGFIYRDEVDGKTKCTHCDGGKVEEWFDKEGRNYRLLDMLDPDVVSTFEKREVDCPQCSGTQQVDNIVRVAKEVPCPKDDVVKQLLDECEETGRIVLFAAFTGTIDRLVKLCHFKSWAVVRCDGRGMVAFDKEGKQLKADALRYWKDWQNQRVAFVAHPESGGYGLTLTESRMAVHFSNVFKSEVRVQADERIHRPGADENVGVEIVDIAHLPSDERVMETVKEDRRVELMSLGKIYA